MDSPSVHAHLYTSLTYVYVYATLPICKTRYLAIAHANAPGPSAMPMLSRAVGHADGEIGWVAVGVCRFAEAVGFARSKQIVFVLDASANMKAQHKYLDAMVHSPFEEAIVAMCAIDMCADMCVDTCVDMCVGMCIGMYMDMCIGII